MQKVLQQRWICKVGKTKFAKTQENYQTKRLNKKKFITRKTTKINKLQTEPDAKKLTAMGVMRNAMTTRAPGGANNTCLMKK